MAAVVIKIAAVVNSRVITFNTLGRSEESETEKHMMIKLFLFYLYVRSEVFRINYAMNDNIYKVNIY